MRVDGDRVVGLRATAPLAAKVRATDDGPEVMVVGSAASLLEGDELHVALTLGPGARLTVTTVAAQVAHPCPDGGWTALCVTAHVGAGAVLHWRPEPTVVCAGGRHRAGVTVSVGEGATVTWLEELVLGRTGEDPTAATVVSELHVDHDGAPLVRDGLDTTLPGAHGPGGLGAGVRYVGAHHRWGGPGGAAAPPATSAIEPSCEPAIEPPTDTAVTFALAGAGRVRRVLHRDPAAGRAALTG